MIFINNLRASKNDTISFGIVRVLVVIALCMGMYASTKANHLQPWVDFTQNYTLNTQLRLMTNFGSRSEAYKPNWGQLHTQAKLAYSYREVLMLDISGRLFYNYQRIKNDLLEIRPTAGLKLNWPDLTYFSFDHQFKYEHRRFWGVENPYYAQSNRVRFRVQTVSSQLLNNSKHPVKLFVWNETFIPWQSDNTELFRDTNRMCAGIQMQMNRRLKIKCGYIIQSARNEKTETFDDDIHILRLTVIRN